MRITLKTRDGLVVCENCFHTSEDVRVEVLLPSWLSWLSFTITVKVENGTSLAVLRIST